MLQMLNVAKAVTCQVSGYPGKICLPLSTRFSRNYIFDAIKSDLFSPLTMFFMFKYVGVRYGIKLSKFYLLLLLQLTC